MSYEDDMRDDEFDEQGTAIDSADEAAEPELFYGSVDEFVREYPIKVYRRPVGAQGGMKWSARSWEYPEALSRLDALWRAWEHLRLDAATGMSVGWRDHAAITCRRSSAPTGHLLCPTIRTSAANRYPTRLPPRRPVPRYASARLTID